MKKRLVINAKATEHLHIQREKTTRIDLLYILTDMANCVACSCDDHEFDEEIDVIYQPNASEIKDNFSNGDASVWKIFVDGNEADFDNCEDEATLFNRVWWLSKPPKIPARTCVVPARRIQVIQERLSSTVKGLPCTSESRGRTPKCKKKRQIVKSNVEYVNVHSVEEKKTASCQEESVRLIPACARTLDELL